MYSLVDCVVSFVLVCWCVVLFVCYLGVKKGCCKKKKIETMVGRSFLAGVSDFFYIFMCGMRVESSSDTRAKTLPTSLQ